MKWYIFSTREHQQMTTLETAVSYSRAVQVAQEEIGTDDRPKRVFEGMYRLRNTRTEYQGRYIVREDMMRRYGFGHLCGLTVAPVPEPPKDAARQWRE